MHDGLSRMLAGCRWAIAHVCSAHTAIRTQAGSPLSRKRPWSLASHASLLDCGCISCTCAGTCTFPSRLEWFVSNTMSATFKRAAALRRCPLPRRQRRSSASGSSESAGRGPAAPRGLLSLPPKVPHSPELVGRSVASFTHFLGGYISADIGARSLVGW